MLALIALALPACSEDDKTPTYDETPRAVRTFETAIPHKETKVGEVVYTVLGLRTKIGDVVGSHGSILPKGQYVRIRIAMDNRGRDRHDFDVFKQQLVTTDGQAVKPSYDAMEVSRSPTGPVSIARDERREFDLWFDMPKAATVRALRVNGDASASELDKQLKGGSAGPPTADISLKT